jgi:hypothetical protein
LKIAGRTVPGEGDRARVVQQLLLNGADRQKLADAGVGWVVVESSGGTGRSAPPLPLPVAYHDAHLTLYRVGGDHPAASGRGIVISAHLVWVGALTAGLVGMVIGCRRRGRRAVPATSA